jgi:hypothetical protein
VDGRLESGKKIWFEDIYEGTEARIEKWPS